MSDLAQSQALLSQYLGEAGVGSDSAAPGGAPAKEPSGQMLLSQYMKQAGASAQHGDNEGPLASIATGFNRGLASGFGAFPALTEIENLPIAGYNLAAHALGAPKAFQNVPLLKDRVTPAIEHAMNRVGIETPAPQTFGQTVGQSVGQFLPFAAGGEGGLLARMGSAAILGAGSGAGQYAGENIGTGIDGQTGKDIGGFIGSVAGGGAAAIGEGALTGAARGAAMLGADLGAGAKDTVVNPSTGEPLTDAYGRPLRATKAQIVGAGKRIAAGARVRPGTLANEISEGAQSPVPGFEPTVGQSTGNLGALALERELRNRYRSMFIARDAANTAALQKQLAGIAPEEAADTARNFVRTHLDALRAGEEAETGTLAENARAAASGLGSAPSATNGADLGAEARTRLEAIRSPVKAAASQALEAVDPDHSLAVDASPVAQRARALLGNANDTSDVGATRFSVNPRVGETLAGPERSVLDAAANMNSVVSFDDLRGLLGEIGRAQRAIKVDPALGAESRPFARMSMLRQSVEDAMANGAAEKASEETAAGFPDVVRGAEGQPLRLYHGTAASFDRFSPEMKGVATGDVAGREGYFFTDNPELASQYAGSYGDENPASPGGQLKARWEALAAKADRTGNAADLEEARKAEEKYLDLSAPMSEHLSTAGANVRPAYLQMANPLVADMRGQAAQPAEMAQIMREARQAGHDGVIFRNIVDSARRYDGAPSDVYAVFSPEQIHPAFGAQVSQEGTGPVTTAAAPSVVSDEDIDAAIMRHWGQQRAGWYAANPQAERADAFTRRTISANGPPDSGRYAGTGPGSLPSVYGAEGAGRGEPRGPAGNPGLQGQPAGLVPNFDAEARRRLQTANRAYADYKQRFRNGPVGNVLASGNTPSGYRLGDSQVVSRLFAKGPQGGDAAAALIRAAGSPEEAANVLGDYPAYSLRKAAEKNGIIDPKAYERWAAQHKEALDRLPALRQKFGTAAEAAQAVQDATARWRGVRSDAENSALRHYVGAAPQTAVQRIFQSPDPAGQARDLVRMLRGNPDAMAGAQRNVADWFINKVKGTAEAGTTGEREIAKASLQKMVRDPKTATALRLILGKPRFQVLQGVSDALDLAARSYQAVGIKGSPGTAADLHAMMAHEQPSLLTQVVIGEVGGQALDSLLGLAPGPWSGAIRAAGAMAGAVRRYLTANGISSVDQLAVEGVLHPELGRMLLRRAATSVKPSLLTALGHRLALSLAVPTLRQAGSAR